MPKTGAKIKASTQQHLDLDDIADDLIIFKTGWVGLVLSTTAVNFDLLSEAEQDATIYAYGAFLNSLTFPVQILIRSKKADITAYFNNLEEAEKVQPNPDIKRQIQKYRDFIQSIVQQRTVLDKKFYIIVNFSPLELGFKGLTKRNVEKTKSKRALIEDAKATLMPKRDHIIKQLARLGLVVRQLTSQELIELFYDIYNPAPTGTQRVILDSASYTVPIVEPAVEVPSPAPAPQPQSKAADTQPQSPPPVAETTPPAPTPQSNAAGESDSPPSGAGPVPDLIPVPPQPAPVTPAPTPFAQEPTVPAQPQPAAPQNPPASNLSGQQAAALSNLQQAAAKAAQMANKQSFSANKQSFSANKQTTQAVSQNSQQELKPNV